MDAERRKGEAIMESVKRPRKKIRIIVYAIILVMAVSAGLTYAWFVSQVDAGPDELIMSELGIKAILDADDEEELLEPGLDVTKTATFTNIGTIPLCAKLGLETEVTVYRDVSGKPLSDPAGMPAPAGDNYVSVDMDIENLVAEGVIEIEGENYVFAWLYDKNNPSDLYLFADPKVAADMDFIVDINSATPNQYMGAKISFVNSAKATQIHSGAILDELGVNVDNLGYVSELQGKSYDQHPTVKAWLDGKLSR